MLPEVFFAALNAALTAGFVRFVTIFAEIFAKFVELGKKIVPCNKKTRKVPVFFYPEMLDFWHCLVYNIIMYHNGYVREKTGFCRKNGIFLTVFSCRVRTRKFIKE